MDDINYLFNQNKLWAEKITQEQPEFFDQLAKQQTPEYLWIGCSDSRVPANQLLGLPPGEIFVHRNIANVVVHTDLNCLSVIQYAVEVLKVKHIFVCGHYGCGGVAASMTEDQHGLIDNWLRHIKDVQRFNKSELDALTEEERFNRLCELNVVEQVKNVSNTTMVQNAWDRQQPLTVHGFIYDIKNGILKNLDVSVSN
ncbi:carbonate dehydratase [Thalassotalea sp. PS06]|uniref:carbonate dehydratase n=1 Tax=Thalassotalea sp. PS06 TaxID=2594005 RepID=UPI00116501C2|nr:carbonate dehydratase [Thalassotalea sp. PS06]QDP00869.1 carbonate dehydratase [Thalassotalea sp. PS06]